MNPRELSQLWQSVVRPPAGRLNGRRLAAVSVPLWLAVDVAHNWHLLVEVPSDTPHLVTLPTRGLTVTTQEMQVADERPAMYVDLGCAEPGLRETFLAVVADLAESLVGGHGEGAEVVVRRVLDRWRRFWSVPHTGLSEDAALGLFGELWFLERWLLLPQGVHRWRGPEGARHDFQWEDVSVEVKASRTGGEGAPVHRISSLSQLDDPERGQLYLFSLHVTRDALATHTLPILVERLRHVLVPHVTEATIFDDRLAQAGYSPAHAERYGQQWRIVGEQLYLVGSEFPRLIAHSFVGGIPPGVREIAYSLDLAACAEWRIADRPSAPAAAFLRS